MSLAARLLNCLAAALLLGALVNADGGKFAYAGACADIRIRGYLLTPAIAVGAYAQGSGPDPGGTLQFRSSVTPA